MTATGSHLKIVKLGESVQGVRLLGDPRHPEHAEFRVAFPGGDVTVARTTEGDYWIHVRVNRPEDGGDPERAFGRIADARLDITGRHADDCNAGDFDHPNLYHLAVRVTRDQQPR